MIGSAANYGVLPPLAPLPSPAALLASSRTGALSSSARVLSTLDATPMQAALLANGASGYFLQAPGQSRSQLTVALPVADMTPTGLRMMLKLLMGGSGATKQMLSRLRGQGINVSFRGLQDKLFVMVDGPAAQEAAMAQAALRMLTQPVVDPVLFNGMKTRNIHDLEGDLNNPDEQLANRLCQRVYGPNHPFALSTQASLQEAARQDLSSVMARLQRTVQATGAAQVMMISAQSPAQQRLILDEAIQGSGWYRSAYGSPVTSQRLPLPTGTGLRGLVLVPAQASGQAVIQTFWKTPDVRDPDYVPYKLLMKFLQSENEGALYKVMRQDHGLIYGVDMAEDSRLADGNCYHINVEVPYDKIKPALDDIRATTRAACSAPIPAAVLETLKRDFLRQMRSNLQDAASMGELYSRWLIYDAQPPNLQWLQNAVSRVTPADVQRVANRIFNSPDGMQLVGVTAPLAVLQQWFPGQPLTLANS